jgi:uncharacterized membrane protein YdjX (TVP38/TMEM64 family)
MGMQNFHKKLMIVFLLAAAIGATLYLTDFGKKLSLHQVQQGAFKLKEYVNVHYIGSVFIFIAVYVAINIWFPGATILTLLGGFLYETFFGTAYVMAAATLGGVSGFWISRYFVGNWIQSNWHRQLEGFNQHVLKHGYLFLVLVRMVPIMPYPLVNALCGLTKISTRTMTWTTAVGSLPGILIFTYAGEQLMSIQSVEDVLTPKVITACTLMVAFVISIAIARITLKR